MPAINPHQKTAAPGAPLAGPSPAADSTIHYAFNVPFASDLAGPNTEEILHATGDSVMKWTHPGDAPDDVAVFELPVHTQNLKTLQELCKTLAHGLLAVEAHVVTTEREAAGVRNQVVTVCLSGSPELVHKSRETILSSTPFALV